ncbi:hypothetical protein SBA4_470014 [Candidatus Sulfopaludibacter sp. SbA4]|nr:hypothetical protein SBA4_470014 [Candidatus Sulfopaludibacter sp. SbA4]
MATYKINIDPSGQSAVFNPSTQAVDAGDQVSWTNNDSKPHWPGLLNPDGSFVGLVDRELTTSPPFNVSSVWSAPARVDSNGNQISYTLTYVDRYDHNMQGIFQINPTP